MTRAAAPRTGSRRAPPTAHEMVGRIKSTVEDPGLIERRRAQITSAAIHEFSRLGFHRATIKDVATRAQVSVGLIYQYVGDKEDLLFLSLVDILEAYKRQIPRALAGVTDPLERFRAAARAYLGLNAASPDATLLAYRETASLAKPRRNVIKQLELETNDLIAACIRDCVQAGVFEDVDVQFLSYQITMLSHTWALKAWHFKPKMTVDQYLDRGLELILRGVLVDKRPRARG